MSLAAGCPRCAAPVSEEDDVSWSCRDHGGITPLWRAQHVGYDEFHDHLLSADPIPTWLPWPLPPGWAVNDFGCVALPGREARASFVSCTGTTDLDGVVEVTVVAEEPGVGLGARCAGVDRTDPGADIGDGPAHVKVALDGHPAALWAVSTSDSDAAFDRSVFAGEAQGRWLWLVLRPASAALLLKDDWSLTDLGSLGPQLVDLPFTDVPRAW
ncbi:MAG TPA: DUF6758 family protein [Nocardioidaceae bacterium]|nr:DUF6758 family protein [Nocardioidaceae bacterium]